MLREINRFILAVINEVFRDEYGVDIVGRTRRVRIEIRVGAR